MNKYKELNLPRKNITVTEKECEYLYDFTKKHNVKNSLEVGFAYGTSAIHIMLATGNNHISIDPYAFKKDEWNGVGMENVRKMGLSDQFRLIENYSQFALPKLIDENINFDFAFIDGLHIFDITLVEFYYIDMMMVKGGHIMLHDTYMDSIKSVVSYIETNRKDYELVEYFEKSVMFKKIGEDNRFWKDHFTFKG